MGNNRKENKFEGVAIPYDAESIVADVKSGSGFYEACKKEQARRMSSGRKSLALLSDGLKLLLPPVESSSTDDSGMSDVLKRLHRITREFLVDIYGRGDDTYPYSLKKRIYDLLEDMEYRKEKKRETENKAKEPKPYGPDLSGRQPGVMAQDAGLMQQPPQNYHQPVPEEETPGQIPYRQGEIPSQPQGITPDMLSQLPPIEVGEKLTDEQREMLFNMLLANGCTPEEARDEIMNLGM